MLVHIYMNLVFWKGNNIFQPTKKVNELLPSEGHL